MTEHKETIFDIIPQGCGGRWAFGTIILIYLIAFNETTGPTAVFSTLLAAFYGLISAICKSGTRNLQIPYVRATNKFDFICLFLAFWMDALTVLTACGALARTLSICLDAMTGGLARILILGRNSIENEPWPDVLGVAVVFLLTGMFMLGLENTTVFGILMSIGLIGISGMISTISWLQGNQHEWKTHEHYVSDNLTTFLTASALGTFAFPSEMPNKKGWKRLFGLVLIGAVCLSTILAAGCLSTLVHTKSVQQQHQEYIAVPLFSILELNNYHKLIPAGACLLMLASSGSLLELFPEMYNMIVRMATSEWKILSKQISYESTDSGNPVLAVFIAGSLCAMLAFACPLQNLTYTLAASHLCAGLFRAFYLLYSPYRPKFIQHNNCDSSLKSSYSRLATSMAPEAGQRPTTSASSIGRRRSVWNFSLPKSLPNTTSSSSSSQLKAQHQQREIEKEWLLLGEPSSPCPQPHSPNDETILSDCEPHSEFNFPDRIENTDSDLSTDIDAIVDEYREQIKVTTAGPMERTIRMPSIASWRVTIFAIIVIKFGIGLMIFGIYFSLLPAYITGFIGIILVSIMMSFIPKYTQGNGLGNVSPILSAISLTLGTILLTTCLNYSWPAIIFWLIGGLMLLIRCDYWCSCFDNTICLSSSSTTSLISTGDHFMHQQQQLLQQRRRICIPRPPKSIIIPGRIQGQPNR